MEKEKRAPTDKPGAGRVRQAAGRGSSLGAIDETDLTVKSSWSRTSNQRGTSVTSLASLFCSNSRAIFASLVAPNVAPKCGLRPLVHGISDARIITRRARVGGERNAAVESLLKKAGDAGGIHIAMQSWGVHREGDARVTRINNPKRWMGLSLLVDSLCGRGTG